MKPYYDRDGITIYHGDAREILPTLEPGSVDLVLTDPPYNMGYAYASYRDKMDDAEYFQWQLETLEDVERVLKDNGGNYVYLNYPEFAARLWAAACEVSGLRPFEWVTWVYNTHTGGKPLRKGSRAWLWFVKGQPCFNADAFQGEYRNPTDRRVAQLIEDGRKPVGYDWWLFEQIKNVSQEKTDHPCQLPVEMVSRWIRGVSPDGGLVVDPFLGSGTTLCAAKNLGRNAIGIEIDEGYCEIAAKRMAQAVLL